MSLFERQIQDLRQILSEHTPDFNGTAPPNIGDWPRSGAKQMILEQDMGVELGNGRLASFAVIMWTADLNLVEDGRIRVYGQDIPQIASLANEKSRPFGKIVLLGASPPPAEDLYEAYEKMNAVRFDLNLKGYMLRGFITQKNREWSRITKTACQDGFSFSTLGRELTRDYKKLPFVKSAEVLFFTDDNLIRRLTPLTEDATKITKALNTMFENINMDCQHCESSDICDDVNELRSLHKHLRKE